MDVLRKKRTLAIILLVLAFATVLIWLPLFNHYGSIIADYFHFTFLGIIGAIFANATGAGGGVIFIPVFSQLNFTTSQSVATSFAIQCFGMTAGAISWWLFYKKNHRLNPQWQQLPFLLILCTPLSIAGLWLAHFLGLNAPSSLEFTFSVFSIILGLAILFSNSPRRINANKQIRYHQLTKKELILLAAITFIGGIITSWLSVGVGELIVIFLILARACPTMAVATGVIVTAFTVWSISPVYLNPSSNTNFYVILFAGPGAIIGGILARKLAIFLPVKQLKTFFGSWIIFSGLSMILIEMHWV